MSSEQNTDANSTTISTASLLPAYLRVELQYGVIVCTEHRSGYTPGKNIKNHLVNAHQASKAIRDNVQQFLQDNDVANTVSEPPNNSPPISGLQIYTAWQCNIFDCNKLSQSHETITKHSSSVHGHNTKSQRDKYDAVVQVSAQRWFANSQKYWTIDFRAASSRPTTLKPARTPAPRSSQVLNTSIRTPLSLTPSDITPSTSLPTHSSSNNIFADLYNQVCEDHRSIRRIHQEAEHPSEITPWERTSGYTAHFRGLDLEELNPLLAVPRHPQADSVGLFHVGKSINRVLTRPYRRVSELHPILAQTLLSFEAERTSAKLFTFLQNVDSFKKYVSVFQSMVCYFHRMVHQNPFSRALFQITEEQYMALTQLDEATGALVEYCSSPSPEEEDDDDSEGQDPEQERLESALDDATLRLFMTLIQHRTFENPYDSAILSFCAAASHSRVVDRWVDESQAGSLLSKVIYCCQLVFLAEARRLCTDGADFGVQLTNLVDQWMKKTAYGPLGDIVRLRLYPMAVARQVVNVAPIRWRSDQETLMYKEITFRISDLQTEITVCLERAQTIFRRDLCFGLPQIPTFELTELSDNWDDLRPGASFLTDIRNGPLVEAHEKWLFTRILENPALYAQTLQQNSDFEGAGEQIRSVFANEYERCVQDFLVYMSILMHKGSGQPGRGPEFLGIRWRNKLDGQGPRNVFIHDGYVLFLLTYHKSLHRTHASRYPVRFLLPEVGQLLVQYLVLIMPLRYVCFKSVQIPDQMSEYLWWDRTAIWTQPRWMKYARDIAQQAHGVPVNIASWRQIAVGIAMKKFGGTNYQADLDTVGDEYDDIAGQTIMESWGGGAMADVFHHQAAHSVSTGNRAYGGSINFERGLTDAGLQEYFKASRLWHQLCRPVRVPSHVGHRRQASQELSRPTVEASLRQRLAYRNRPTRYRQQYGSDQIHFAMRKMFRTTNARFRSPHQEQLIDAIVTGCPEVIGVLATGEGKSLAFLLPPCLPNAGMTVVVVPLVALKADIVRRCTESGLCYAVWQSHDDASSPLNAPLLFVSVDQAVRQRFRSFLGQLDASGRLDRIVFDEAHLILTTSTYRLSMALVKHLRQLHCQIVLLTATLPSTLQTQLEARLFLKAPRTIRSRTFRTDIAYRVVRARTDDLVQSTTDQIQILLKQIDSPEAVGARILVYTLTRDEADRLSARLACPKYYSDSSDDAGKLEAMQMWQVGRSKVLVATSAFGAGIDYPAVRYVVHMGAPRDMIDFAQEVGRANRDGRYGTSQVLLPRSWTSPELPSAVDQRRTPISKVAMSVYLGKPRCYSATLSRFLDGTSRMQYCNPADKHPCSRCDKYGFVDSQDKKDLTTWWEEDTGQGHGSDQSEDNSEDDSTTQLPQASRSTKVGHPTTDSDGDHRLRASMRDVGIARRRYENGIQTLKGRCMICMILGQGQVPLHEQIHPLEQCRHSQRTKFLEAKKQALARNRSRGGWLKSFVACFRCGQPQEICQVDEEGSQRLCQYRDMVLPAAWALFHRKLCWGRTLGAISGMASHITTNEDRWMDWLGTGFELHEMRASQAARMMDQVIRLELADVDGS